MLTDLPAMKKTIVLIVFILSGNYCISQINMSGLSLWLKADEGVEKKENDVLRWRDQSGHHHDALVTPSLQSPQYIPNALNGKPVIRFNGINNGLQTDSFQTFPNKRGTIFMVLKINGPSTKSGSGANSLISTYLGKKTTWQFVEMKDVYCFYDGEGAQGFPVAALFEQSWEVVSINRYNDTTFKLYRRGEPRVDFNVKNNQPDVNAVKIGSNGRLEVMNGDIAEILIYNRSLTEAEIKEVNRYLLSKYNIEPPPVPFKNTIWYYGLWLIGIIGTTAIITAYVIQRNIKKKLAEIENQQKLEKERQRISREMHDDIGAGLTQIVLMSEAAKNKDYAIKELNDIAETSRKLVNNMSEIIWSLNSENKTVDQLFSYLRELLNKQLEYSPIAYTIQLSEPSSPIMLDNAQKRNMILIVKEAVNNAIKYSKASMLSIQMYIEEKNMIIHISDNGIGFDVANANKGNGLKNMQQRMRELKGSFELHSQITQGTFIKCIIPL